MLDQGGLNIHSPQISWLHTKFTHNWHVDCFNWHVACFVKPLWCYWWTGFKPVNPFFVASLAAKDRSFLVVQWLCLQTRNILQVAAHGGKHQNATWRLCSGLCRARAVRIDRSAYSQRPALRIDGGCLQSQGCANRQNCLYAAPGCAYRHFVLFFFILWND